MRAAHEAKIETQAVLPSAVDAAALRQVCPQPAPTASSSRPPASTCRPRMRRRAGRRARRARVPRRARLTDGKRSHVVIDHHRRRPRRPGPADLGGAARIAAATGSTAASPSSSARPISAARWDGSASIPIRWAAPISNALRHRACRRACCPCATIRSRARWRGIATAFRRSASSTASCAGSDRAWRRCWRRARPRRFIFAPRPRAVRLRPDGTVAVETIGPDGTGEHPLRPLRGRRAGRPPVAGRRRALMPGLTLADCHMRHVMPSDRALSSDGLEEANHVLADGRPAADPDPGRLAQCLFGGRRACSDCRLPSAWPRARSIILQRREPRVFYPDREAALDDLYDVDAGRHLPAHPEGQSHGRPARLRPRNVAPDRATSAARRPSRGSSPWTMQQSRAAELRAMIAERRWSCRASAIARQCCRSSTPVASG